MKISIICPLYLFFAEFKGLQRLNDGIFCRVSAVVLNNVKAPGFMNQFTGSNSVHLNIVIVKIRINNGDNKNYIYKALLFIDDWYSHFD